MNNQNEALYNQIIALHKNNMLNISNESLHLKNATPFYFAVKRINKKHTIMYCGNAEVVLQQDEFLQKIHEFLDLQPYSPKDYITLERSIRMLEKLNENGLT
jgi:hypothetical protein